MGPNPKRDLPVGALVPANEEDLGELQLAVAETESVALSPEELELWAETGECPESLS